MTDNIPTPRSCTTMDHVWKVSLWFDKVKDGQKCLCGARAWNDAKMLGKGKAK